VPPPRSGRRSGEHQLARPERTALQGHGGDVGERVEDGCSAVMEPPWLLRDAPISAGRISEQYSAAPGRRVSPWMGELHILGDKRSMASGKHVSRLLRG
jgi:hypothetical protein